LLFAVIGGATAIRSLAATPTVHFEAEQASLSGSVQQVADSTASGGQLVQFGESTMPPHTDCTPGTLGMLGPCINNSLIPASKPGVSTVRMETVGLPGSGGEPGAFRQRCDYSHMNNDDAILYPGRPGAAHLHTYFGNSGANASATSASLRNSGTSTCAGGIFNRSAYWIPAMVDAPTGRPIAPSDRRENSVYLSDLEIYYKKGYQGTGYLDTRPFPNGLHIIAGNPATATSPQPDSSTARTHYWCEGPGVFDRDKNQYGLSIPNCPAGNVLVMLVDFPQCWDGVNLTSANGRSHMAYGTWQPGANDYTRGCPATHPVGLPFVQMIVRYMSPTGGTANWRLASDNYTNGPGGYSGHADYMFAWDESAFPAVVQNCYAKRLDCGYSLGDGRNPLHIRR